MGAPDQGNTLVGRVGDGSTAATHAATLDRDAGDLGSIPCSVPQFPPSSFSSILIVNPSARICFTPEFFTQSKLQSFEAWNKSFGSVQTSLSKGVSHLQLTGNQLAPGKIASVDTHKCLYNTLHNSAPIKKKNPTAAAFIGTKIH